MSNPSSGLKDNHSRGSIGDFIKEKACPGTLLSFVSAYFTIHAYHGLRDCLEGADSLRFLFGEPRFLVVDPDDKDTRQFRLTEKGLSLGNQLVQRKLAQECADWIQRKGFDSRSRLFSQALPLFSICRRRDAHQRPESAGEVGVIVKAAVDGDGGHGVV
jgi:hypothetical protein